MWSATCCVLNIQFTELAEDPTTLSKNVVEYSGDCLESRTNQPREIEHCRVRRAPFTCFAFSEMSLSVPEHAEALASSRTTSTLASSFVDGLRSCKCRSLISHNFSLLL